MVRNALAVQRDERSTAGDPQQNSHPLNLPPQLLTPCEWTVHPLEGGLARLTWFFKAWAVGAVTAQIIIRGAVAAQRERQWLF